MRYWTPVTIIPITPSMPMPADIISRTKLRMCQIPPSLSSQLMILVSAPPQVAANTGELPNMMNKKNKTKTSTIFLFFRNGMIDFI